MARTRREKTLADYVVIALSPALIMTLVGSLAFFLLSVAYKGQFETRVQWVLFWFVMGAVLVARIAIEQEKEQASLLGWILAGLTALFVYKFVESDAVVVAWILLAVIWWCSWKLTWDCTLIDDGEDSSGEGLIEAAGLVGSQEDSSTSSAGGAVAARSLQAESGDERLPLWRKLFADPSRRRKRPHAPGLWVVYFSLAALPLFGVGQLFIPAVQAGRRSYAFLLLAVYVASALGLLLTTSFLGLRRYLRQRKLQMPAAMTATWIGMGTALAIGLLLLALLIPRPQGEYTVTEWIDKADAKVREASRLAILRDGKGQGEGRRIGEHDPKAAQPGQQPPPNKPQPDQQQQAGKQDPNQQQPGQQQAANQQPGNQPGGQDGKNPKQAGEKNGQGGNRQQAQAKGQGQQQGQGDAKGDQAGQKGEKADGRQDQQVGQQQGQQNQQQADAQQPDAKQNGAQQKPGEQLPRGQNAQAANQPPAPPPTPPAGSMLTNLLTSLAPFVKWILYGLLAAVVLYVVFRNFSRFVEMLLNLWNELLSLFGLGTRPEHAGGSSSAESAPEPPPPFASFDDPFLSGAARRMSAAQLVRYTFEAIEAWAREQGLPRPSGQTPLEYAAELGRQIPKASKDISETAQIYVQVAYARGNPSRDSLEVLERMWRRMNVMANT